METDSKKTQEEGSTSEDRISYLPNSILSHIQSFLATEDIVRASFVSKSWKSLLSPLSVIDLDFDRFSKNSCLNDKKKRFAEFVQLMLVLHKGRYLKELRLIFDISQFESDDIPQIDDWVSFVMTSESKILHLDFWGGKELFDPNFWNLRCFALPQCSSFPHKSVEALAFTHCIFRPSKDMYFHSVKTAIFSAVHLPGESVQVFVAASPCLEVLYLVECILPAHFKVLVMESKLNDFVFDSCTSYKEDISSFEINIPSLMKFRFEGKMITNFCLNHPKNLIQVDLDFLDDFTRDDQSQQAIMLRSLLADIDNVSTLSQQTIMLRSLLADIDNVNTLILSRSCLKVLSADDRIFKALVTGELDCLPAPLYNLKHLTQKWLLAGLCEFLSLAVSLRISPNLETLSIDLSSPCEAVYDLDLSINFDFSQEEPWASFLFPCNHLQHLKKVHIKGFEGRTNEMDLVQCMLMNSLSLKEMVICKGAMRSRYAKVKQAGDKYELKLLKAYQRKTIENLLALRRESEMTENNSVKKLEREQGFDRISELPDPILSHILSLLPTEDVAGITLLSKRLNSLWSPLSVLDLDFLRFSETYSDSTPEDQKKRFTGFVEHMIVLHRGRHLEKFRLAVNVSLDNLFVRNTSLIHNWVLYALTSNSVVVDLHFWGGREECKLPPCSSVVQSVTVLKLSNCEFVPLSYKGFESLKTLILSGVLLPEDSVNDVLVKCPDLEELHLKQCIVPSYFEFEAPPKSKLKCFVLESISGQDDENISNISISVPSLLKFRFSGVMIEDFDVHAKNLNEAEINFHDEIMCLENHYMMRGLLSDLRNVNTLTICESFLVLLSEADDAPVKYLGITLNNLKYLSAETCLYGSQLKDFVCFLLSCPNLETLCINLIEPWPSLHRLDRFWESLALPLDCLRHLKTIELITFEGKSHEMEFLSYMLNNALVLKKVDICVVVRRPYFSSKQDEEEMKLVKAQSKKTKENILALPRPPDVEIVL